MVKFEPLGGLIQGMRRQSVWSPWPRNTTDVADLSKESKFSFMQRAGKEFIFLQEEPF
jgi:hypothetical protein